MNTELVKQIARHVASTIPANVVDVDDLIQVGTIGLLEAQSRYTADFPGVSFEAYASSRVRGAMIDELRNSDWLSREYRKQYKTVHQVTQQLFHRLGRKPADSEVAAEANIPFGKYREVCLNINLVVISLEDLKIQDSDSEAFLDHFCIDDNADPLKIIQDKERNDAVVDAFNTLPQKDRSILQMSYIEGKTLKEIGTHFAVTEARAHQMRKQSLDKIRLTLEDYVL